MYTFQGTFNVMKAHLLRRDVEGNSSQVDFDVGVGARYDEENP